MQTKTFISIISQDDNVDPIDATCIRMRCGHAYHSACIIGCFRSGRGCPSCREEITPAAIDHQLIELEGEFDIEEEPDPIIDRLDGERMVLRVRNNDIRKAREKLNKSVKSYRILCENLKSERRTIIRNALQNFRNTRKAKFNAASQNVRKSLSEVKRVEFKALLEKSSENELKIYEDWVGEDYDFYEFIKSKDFDTPDPLSKPFWRG